MKIQWDNEAISSFVLWLDHTILSKGDAYVNFSSKIFPIDSPYTNFYMYGLPFRQIVADASITGAQIMSGIYVNGVYCNIGQSGIVDISYEKGHVYSTQNLNNARLSGNFAVKDFNVYLTSKQDYEILFETKYETRPKTSRALTGLAPDVVTYPVIFVKNMGSSNTPFALGGQETTTVRLRLSILADSQFGLDAVSSIIRDKKETYIPLISSNNMPFNNLGGAVGGRYSYNERAAASSSPYELFISRVDVSRFGSSAVNIANMNELTTDIFSTLIDVDLEAVRQPRL